MHVFLCYIFSSKFFSRKAAMSSYSPILETEQVHIYPDGRMDTKNSAKYVGLSEKTLAMMRCSGKGPDFIKRGKIFYFKQDLDDWLQGGRQSSQPVSRPIERA